MTNGIAESAGRAIAVMSSSHKKKRGMILPFEPYSITFDQIVYSVDMPLVSRL